MWYFFSKILSQNIRNWPFRLLQNHPVRFPLLLHPKFFLSHSAIAVYLLEFIFYCSLYVWQTPDTYVLQIVYWLTTPSINHSINQFPLFRVWQSPFLANRLPPTECQTRENHCEEVEINLFFASHPIKQIFFTVPSGSYHCFSSLGMRNSSGKERNIPCRNKSFSVGRHYDNKTCKSTEEDSKKK